MGNVARWVGIGLVILVGAGAPLRAAEVTVRVFERAGGTPVGGAAVCLGTAADPGQFAQARSDDAGEVRVDAVPNATLVVTVSRDGYRGERRRLPASGSNRQVVLSLVPGGGGPRCEAGGAPPSRDPDSSPELRLHGLRAEVEGRGAGQWQVRVTPRMSGTATEFRLGWDQELAGAEWQPYGPGPAVTASLPPPPGPALLHFQLRRQVTVAGADLEQRTRIRVVPLR